MTVAVIGLGKIGLPLAVQIAGSGLLTIGADISDTVVRSINNGVPPFPGEKDLDSKLRSVVADGLFSASTDTSAAVQLSDVVVVVVPLVTDAEGVPDFAALDAATADLSAGLQPGTLVSYETTLPVGTTRNRFGPAIEALSGLSVGSDFFLVHSPERVFSGRVFADLRRYPKLVGGVDAASTERAEDFYRQVLEFDARPDLPKPNGVWTLTSVEAAEMAKLAETTYRDVNIALANEFGRYAESSGIDVREVIDAANSQPYSHIHQPGVAVGGHCIPVYPMFYLQGDPDARLVSTAREVNKAVPGRVVGIVADELEGLTDRTVLILGVAYRGGVKESAFSGVFDLAREVTERGGHPVVSDPLYTDEEILALGLEPWDGADVAAAIIQADHSEYQNLEPEDVGNPDVLFDGRGSTLEYSGHAVTIGKGTVRP